MSALEEDQHQELVMHARRQVLQGVHVTWQQVCCLLSGAGPLSGASMAADHTLQGLRSMRNVLHVLLAQCKAANCRAVLTEVATMQIGQRAAACLPDSPACGQAPQGTSAEKGMQQRMGSLPGPAECAQPRSCAHSGARHTAHLKPTASRLRACGTAP